jgi:hypothetical protein
MVWVNVEFSDVERVGRCMNGHSVSDPLSPGKSGSVDSAGIYHCPDRRLRQGARMSRAPRPGQEAGDAAGDLDNDMRTIGGLNAVCAGQGRTKCTGSIDTAGEADEFWLRIRVLHSSNGLEVAGSRGPDKVLAHATTNRAGPGIGPGTLAAEKVSGRSAR